jgi:hypothetical protein
MKIGGLHCDAGLGQNTTWKTIKAKKTGGEAQMVEYLSTKPKFNPSTKEKN